MRKPFKVGQRAWSSRWGWGEVCEINAELPYPVLVQFDTFSETYTSGGMVHKDHARPTLFHNEIPIDQWPDPDPPLPELAVDTPVWVRYDEEIVWWTRHFARWENGLMCVYPDGRTSHTARPDVLARFTEWSLTKPEEA